MKDLNIQQCNEISGGDDNNAWFHIVMTPDEFNAQNLIGASVFGGGILGAYKAGKVYWPQDMVTAVVAGAAGMTAGALIGGAGSAGFLTVTKPIYNFVNENFG